MKHRILTLLLLVLLSACSRDEAAYPEEGLDSLVDEYLFLELSMGLHDAAHVDAYFGPEDF